MILVDKHQMSTKNEAKFVLSRQLHNSIPRKHLPPTIKPAIGRPSYIDLNELTTQYVTHLKHCFYLLLKKKIYNLFFV